MMLFIVATPIGTLEDLSVRQARILTRSDIILTEDTRSAAVLFQAIERLFGFKRQASQTLISYYKERELEKLPEVLRHLEAGKQVSLISDSGMPLVSDPGWLLVKTVVERSLPLEVVPGPSALTTIMPYSAFRARQTFFLGFLPKKEGDIRRLFERINVLTAGFPDCQYVFYDSPHRLSKSLAILSEVMPTAQVVVGRELTKRFQELLRGSPSALAKTSYKGEVTVLFYR